MVMSLNMSALCGCNVKNIFATNINKTAYISILPDILLQHIVPETLPEGPNLKKVHVCIP